MSSDEQASCIVLHVRGLSPDVSGLGARPKPVFARVFALEFRDSSAVDQQRLIRNQQVAGSIPAGGFIVMRFVAACVGYAWARWEKRATHFLCASTRSQSRREANPAGGGATFFQIADGRLEPAGAGVAAAVRRPAGFGAPVEGVRGK